MLSDTIAFGSIDKKTDDALVFNKKTKSVLIDEYRRSWARRYLREARADLEEAERTPSASYDLKLEALKKAQSSIYFSLGCPEQISQIVEHSILNNVEVKNPVLRCLLAIEYKIQQIIDSYSENNEVEQVPEIVQIASSIVDLYT